MCGSATRWRPGRPRRPPERGRAARRDGGRRRVRDRDALLRARRLRPGAARARARAQFGAQFSAQFADALSLPLQGASPRHARCYMQGSSARSPTCTPAVHRDIKPTNVLYSFAERRTGGRLWPGADSGRAAHGGKPGDADGVTRRAKPARARRRKTAAEPAAAAAGARAPHRQTSAAAAAARKLDLGLAAPRPPTARARRRSRRPRRPPPSPPPPPPPPPPPLRPRVRRTFRGRRAGALREDHSHHLRARRRRRRRRPWQVGHGAAEAAEGKARDAGGGGGGGGGKARAGRPPAVTFVKRTRGMPIAALGFKGGLGSQSTPRHQLPALVAKREGTRGFRAPRESCNAPSKGHRSTWSAGVIQLCLLSRRCPLSTRRTTCTPSPRSSSSSAPPPPPPAPPRRSDALTRAPARLRGGRRRRHRRPAAVALAGGGVGGRRRRRRRRRRRAARRLPEVDPAQRPTAGAAVRLLRLRVRKRRAGCKCMEWTVCRDSDLSA